MLGVGGTVLNYHYRNNTLSTLSNEYTSHVLLISDKINKLESEFRELKQEIKKSRIQYQNLTEKIRIAEAKKTESWNSFAYRKSLDIYRYFVPLNTTSVR